jgi:hypothetical protein
MQPDPNSISSHGTGFTGAIIGMASAIISMLPQLELWLRIGAAGFGMIAAIVSIFVMLEKRSIERKQRLK